MYVSREKNKRKPKPDIIRKNQGNKLAKKKKILSTFEKKKKERTRETTLIPKFEAIKNFPHFCFLWKQTRERRFVAG